MKVEKSICYALLAFGDSGDRHRSTRTHRLRRPQLSLANGDEFIHFSGSRSIYDSHARRKIIQTISNSLLSCMVLMNAKSADAACLSGDFRPECIGVYKLPIDAAESPYVATPEKLKMYAPDVKWVPPTPYPPTYVDALKQLKDQRQHLGNAQDLIAKGNIEAAGLALLEIIPKVSVAGKIILQDINKSSNDERNVAMKMDATTNAGNYDGNSSSYTKAVTLEMKAYRIKTTLDDLLGYLGETDILIGQGLRGELGVSAPAQIQILSSLSNCMAEFDNLLRIIPDELSR